MPIILDNKEGCLFTDSCKNKNSECKCKERGTPHICKEFDNEETLTSLPSTPEVKIKGKTLLHG